MVKINFAIISGGVLILDKCVDVESVFEFFVSLTVTQGKVMNGWKVLSFYTGKKTSCCLPVDLLTCCELGVSFSLAG